MNDSLPMMCSLVLSARLQIMVYYHYKLAVLLWFTLRRWLVIVLWAPLPSRLAKPMGVLTLCDSLLSTVLFSRSARSCSWFSTVDWLAFVNGFLPPSSSLSLSRVYRFFGSLSSKVFSYIPARSAFCVHPNFDSLVMYEFLSDMARW
jgi:hypothetical protein